MIYEGFVHLHVHSHYSLLYSTLSVERIIQECRNRGIAAMALTDRGNIHGAVRFFSQASRHGIKAILGCEFTLRLDDGVSGAIVVLVRDDEGYRSLLRLLDCCWSGGRQEISPNLISLRELRESAQGLVLLTGGGRGPLDRLLAMGQTRAAHRLIQGLKSDFGENLFVEVTSFRPQGSCTVDQIRQLAAELAVPCIASADAVATDSSQEGARDLLLELDEAAGQGSSGPQERGLGNRFLTDREGAAHLFREEEFENALKAAGLCKFDLLEFFSRKGPHYPVLPSGPEDPQARLEALCRSALTTRFSDDQEASQRLDRELQAIAGRQLASYFLTVREITSFCRREGIPLGPGRGSAAGSLVAYLLGITRVDPLRYGLFFERFLNPGRFSLPDIDIDVCARQRGRVLDFLTTQFGQDRVLGVAAFDTFQEKSAIRAVLASLSVTRQKIDALMSQTSEADEIISSLTEMDTQPFGIPLSVRDRALAISRELLGVARNRTRHAAGVIILPQTTAEMIPVMDREGMAICQFDKESLELLGIPKIDLLALRTLTLLQDTAQALGREGVELSLENLPQEDPQALACIGASSRAGIFQLDSPWMDRSIGLFHPNCFHDIVLLLALIRPGPMKGNVFGQVLRARRGGQERDNYPQAWHDLLQESFGTIVFQEQVMALAARLAGFSLAEADDLRRAMSRKSTSAMETYESRFIGGASERGLNPEEAREIFTRMAHFAGYGFNKSHSVAYAMLTYATGYLKAHYFVHFAVAYMNSEMGNQKKIEPMIRECRDRGIEILPPDINRSGSLVEVLPDGRIVWGLALIRNVGTGLAESIVRRRSETGAFRDLASLMSLAGSLGIQRPAMEALVRSGALDGFGPRARVMAELEAGYTSTGRWMPGVQMSIFDVALSSPAGDRSGDQDQTASECPADMARKQQEVLGFSVYTSPLEEYSWLINAADLKLNGRIPRPREGSLTALLVSCETPLSRQDKNLEAEDLEGGLELNLSGFQGRAAKGLLYVEGRFMDNGRSGSLVVEKACALEKALELPWVVDVDFLGEEIDDDTLAALRGLVAVSSGRVPLNLRVDAGDYQAVIRMGHVPLSRETLRSLEELTGDVPRVHLARGQ